MTEIAIRNGSVIAEAEATAMQIRGAAPAGGILAWAQQAQAAYGIAEKLAATSFVPKAFQGKPDEITAAILTGYEMGMQPMAALRAMDIIQGTPAMKALTLRALVLSHGHEMWTEGDITETRAVVCGRRKGSDKVERSVWTIDRARKMGLANKSEWTKQPGTMLHTRATSDIARRVAPDVILGMPYSIEELDDDREGTEAAPARRTAKRKTPDAVPTAVPTLAPPTIAEAVPPAIPDSAPTVPSNTCAWCQQPGHHEDACPDKESADGDDFDAIEGAWLDEEES